jgi:alkyl sulfatase BDS1-like metallo-beta-lactamase superfamily hydrolase
MGRRARFQFGLTLPRGPAGELTSGLGPRIARGTTTLIAPTTVITRTGETLRIGNLDLVFQVTPGTEAPAEMNFHVPALRALFMAENANLTMHNLLPARGALVRDAKAWADYLTEAVRLYAKDSDVLFAAHGIPRFGTASLTNFLTLHRDAYKYLHDQSVRLMNMGNTGSEIAEVLALPEPLASQWFNRGYYGTMSHNSKAVYQRYMGWYDANPAHLNALPPEPAARRYVEAMGGAAAVLERARTAVAAGEYRWAAMLLDHLVFAGGDTTAARTLLAEVYTQLGYQAEAGTWRNIYLTGAQELTQGVPGAGAANAFSPDVLAATPTSMLLDFAAVRLDAARALEMPFTLRVELTDVQEAHLLSVRNGVLVHERDVPDAADATVTLARPALLMTLFAGAPVQDMIAAGDIRITGDATLLARLQSLITPLDPVFPIVTP